MEKVPVHFYRWSNKHESIRMSFRSHTNFIIPHLRKLRSIKFFFILSCSSFLLSLLWVEIVSHQKRVVKENLIPEALDNVKRDIRFTNVYRKPEYLPKNLKYILLWTRRDYSPFSFLENGQRTFLKNNCSVVNCYVTANQYLFGNDYTKFDAIAFNGRNLNYRLPRKRSPKQKYIYFNMESSENYPVCSRRFNRYFNWTATYRLDSDIPITYVLVRDKNDNNILGPKRKVQWRDSIGTTESNNLEPKMNKSKAAAWFVSNCKTKSRRQVFVDKLQKALLSYKYEIDVFGYCGKLTCPANGKKGGKDDCDSLLKKDYFFYLALENSFAEDYVTEKVLTAVNNDVVPIVYGGADYSRFLPPGSYIDGRKLHPNELAALMDKLIRSPQEYRRYFSWKQHYTFHDPSRIENMCKICEALHDKSMEKTKVYDNFRSWWNSKDRCLF